MAENTEGSSCSSSALEETIRRCVRDEMHNFQSSRSRVQSLLDRTRLLIRESSFSAASELGNDHRLTKTNSQTTTTALRLNQPSYCLHQGQVLHPYLTSALQLRGIRTGRCENAQNTKKSQL